MQEALAAARKVSDADEYLQVAGMQNQDLFNVLLLLVSLVTGSILQIQSAIQQSVNCPLQSVV